MTPGTPPPLDRACIKYIVQSMSPALVARWLEPITDDELTRFRKALDAALGSVWALTCFARVDAETAILVFQARVPDRSATPHQVIKALENELFGRARVQPWSPDQIVPLFDPRTDKDPASFARPWQVGLGALELRLYPKERQSVDLLRSAMTQLTELLGSALATRLVRFSRWIPVPDFETGRTIFERAEAQIGALMCFELGCKQPDGTWWTISWSDSYVKSGGFQVGVARGNILDHPSETYERLTAMGRSVAEHVPLKYATIAFRSSGDFAVGTEGPQPPLSNDQVWARYSQFNDTGNVFPDAYPWQLVESRVLGDLTGDWHQEQVTDELVEVSFPPIEAWRPQGLADLPGYFFDTPDQVLPIMTHAREQLAPVLSTAEMQG
jgi:hypothetical protein